MDDEIESVLYIIREINVHKIPPLKTNEGHRAAEWGDLAKPLWKGRMRIIEKSSGVSILFEDPTTGELFAQAVYDPLKPSVDAVLDSSRYFSVRIEDNGRKAYIGIGFAERTDSFDFNVALQDYTKRYKAILNPPTADDDSEESTPKAPSGPKKDYSLKEGQTFSIAIPGRKTGSTTSSSTSLLSDTSSLSSTSSGGGAFPLLPPPPSSKKS